MRRAQTETESICCDMVLVRSSGLRPCGGKRFAALAQPFASAQTVNLGAAIGREAASPLHKLPNREPSTV